MRFEDISMIPGQLKPELRVIQGILGKIPFSTKRGAPRLRLGNSRPACAVKELALVSGLLRGSGYGR